jgi:hypothetical protein
MLRLAASIAAVLLAGCAMGDLFNGPPPVDVTPEQIIGTWEGQDDAGTFTFAADGTLEANDLPADALDPIEPTQRWSCTGEWEITTPRGGHGDKGNIIRLHLRDLPSVSGGFSTSLSASKRDDVIVLSMRGYWYTKTA